MPLSEEGMRKRIAEFLPRALSTALNSYMKFTKQAKQDNDPVKFKKHHDACKVAIAHIELLIKLAKLVDMPVSVLKGAASNEQMRGLIEYAESEVKRMEAESQI
ncbi:MAG: hypothetical protein KDI13_00105 [Alphaproteobacteria bacterium]|nr:hypothetical protein [Alphaproteobacteria bacterium]